MASQRTSTQRFLSDRFADLGIVLTGFFAIVVAVAGGSAVALLGWPTASGTYFSWDLGAPKAAALIGGLYLASVIIFAEAATRPRQQTRALTLGVLALALPTLVFTAANHTVFDWTRPQAVAWVVLFCSAPISIGLDLHAPIAADNSPPASTRVRVALSAISASSVLLAGGLWIDGTRTLLDNFGPIPLAGLTADYLGAWCAFVAAVTGVAALRGRTSDARSAGVLLSSISIGATIAAVRTSASSGAALIATVAGLAILAVAVRQLVIQYPAPRPTHRISTESSL